MSKIVDNLRMAIQENNVHEIDVLLNDIIAIDDYATYMELFDLFDDNCEFDGFMFAIIHTLANLNREAYIEGFLNKAENLLTNSPKWAVVLLIRLVNNKDSLLILRKLIALNPKHNGTINKLRNEALKRKPDIPMLD